MTNGIDASSRASGTQSRPKRRLTSSVGSLAAVALATGLLGTLAPVAGASRLTNESSVATRNSVTCSAVSVPGVARCDARIRTDFAARHDAPGPNGLASPHVLGNGGAYDPAYLQSAYNVASAVAVNGGGSGQIVAVIEAFDDPNLLSDLAAYRSHFGLAACVVGTVAASNTSCVVQKVNEAGAAGPLPTGNVSWGTEASLDVDMVSAICAKCQILIVEADSALISDLGASVNVAVAMGADVVSNSYGSAEYSSETLDASAYYDHPGVAIVASTGDAGFGVQFPAAAPSVTAVGGTTLTQLTNSGQRSGSETVWTGAGSGCSSFEPKPSWQFDTGCSNRSVADVAAVANPATGVWVYDTYGYSGYSIFGGTSASAPIVGALYALAGNAASTTEMSSLPYAVPSSLTPVTSGANGSCGTYLCDATKSQNGYNGPTGLGTPGDFPNSLAAFSTTASNFVAPSAPSVTSASPSSGSVTLSWTGSTFSGSSDLAGYEVFVGTSPGAESASPANAVAVNGNSFTVAGLAGGTTYYFDVTAVNATNSSAPSNELTASTPVTFTQPGAPSLISAAPGDTAVTLSWSPPTNTGGGIGGYNVYVGTASGAESSIPVNSTLITATTYTVTGLTNATVYYFVVRAVNAAGASPSSNQLSSKPAGLPSAPLGLIAKPGTKSGIALSWSPPSSNGGAAVTSYRILRATSPGTEVFYASTTCSKNGCAFNDTGTVRSGAYFYRVAAVNVIGVGPVSNESSAIAK